MHVDQIRGAYCAGWRTCDDDHQFAALVAAKRQQRLVHLADHVVGAFHVRHDERLGSPRQRQLAAYLG